MSLTQKYYKLISKTFIYDTRKNLILYKNEIILMQSR